MSQSTVGNTVVSVFVAFTYCRILPETWKTNDKQTFAEAAEESLRLRIRLRALTSCLIVTYIRGTNNKPFPPAFSQSPIILPRLLCLTLNAAHTQQAFSPAPPSAVELRLPNLRYRCQLGIFTQVFIAY